MLARTHRIPKRRPPSGPRAVGAEAAVGATASVVVIAAAHTGVDSVTGSVSALLPILEDRFTLSGAQVGALVATMSVSSLLSQPLVGRYADRIGAKKVTAAGAVVSSALLALLGVSQHLGLVYALMVVGGLGAAGFHPAAAAVSRRMLPERAQLAVSIMSAGGMIGLALGPVLVLLIAARAGLGFTPLLMIPGVVLGALLWRLLPEDPAPAERPLPPVRHLLRGPVGRVALAGSLAAVAVTTFVAGMPLWLTQDRRLANDAAEIGWTLGLFEVAGALGGLVAGWASSRIASGRLASISMVAALAPLLLALNATPGSLGFYAAAVAAGALANAAFPLLILAAQDRAEEAVAAASGMLMGFTHGIAGIAFLGIGLLADAAGLRVALVAGFAALIPAAALSAHVLTRRSPSTLRRPAAAPVSRCGALVPCG